MGREKNIMMADNKFMIKSRCLIFLFSILILCKGNALAENNKADLLRDKMIEIESMRKKIKIASDLASGILYKLKDKSQSLKDEIQREQKRLNKMSYQSAAKYPRIEYDLKLLQQLLGYTSALEEKIRYFQIGNANLEFLYQQSEDDLMIMQSIKNMKIDKLLALINLELNKYLSANEKMVDSNKIVFIKPSEIWADIMLDQ